MEYSFVNIGCGIRRSADFTLAPHPDWGKCPSLGAASLRIRGKCPTSWACTGCIIHGLALVLLLLVFIFTTQARAEFAVRCVGVMTCDAMERPLVYPSHVYYDIQEDEIYITDSGNNRIVVCNSNYFPISAFAAAPDAGGLGGMDRIAGRLSVIARGRRQVESGHALAVFDDAFLPGESMVLSAVPPVEEQTFLPYRVVCGLNGKLYVTSENGGPVYVFNRSGVFDHLLQPYDRVLGIREPALVKDVAVDKNGKLYLLSEQRGRVYVYDHNEIMLFKFGQKGGDRGKLARPRGIAVNTARGEIYVVDYLRHAVSVYSMQGDFIDEFGGKGTDQGWFYYPSDVAVDHKGRVLVADTFNHRIQAFALP